jgi:hypothetical protein
VIYTVLTAIICNSVDMATRINPPIYGKEKSYERYKQELNAWREVTDVAKTKKGIVIALTLPENDESGIRERVFDELDLGDLKKEDGLEHLITFMDKHLGKDDLADSLEKFEDFEDFKRESGQNINDFISKFDQKYHKIMKLDMKLPPAILAFMLLKKSNITKSEKMLVLTGMDYGKKDQLYEQAKQSLLKFKGEQGGGGGSTGSTSHSAIKLEPVFMADDEEAMWAAGYARRGSGRGNSGGYHGESRPWQLQRGSTQRGGRGGSSRGYSRGAQNFGREKDARNVNPKGQDGRTLLCNACGSFRHMIAKCPDSWENASNVNIAEEVALFTMMEPVAEDIVLLTNFDKGNIRQFSEESRKCVVLDSACSSTVCGEDWLDDYLCSLEPTDREKVKKTPSAKVYKFGGGERLRSQGTFSIPAVLAGKQIMLTTDVVQSDIPLLLSKAAMKKAGVKLDLENDTAIIFGVDMILNETTSGHYCVPIDRDMSVCAVELDGKLEPQERYKTLLKLHRQFAHPPTGRFKALLQDAGIWKEEFQTTVEGIYEKCEVCKLYKRTPSRPVVAMPMASRFNQRVCMDLKKWRDRWILHFFDMWSRFSVSVFIQRKRPSEVIDKIMTCWVGAAFGVMEGIVSDNGGEFSSDEMREVCSILNVEKITTAADSPFQNGLCERNHAVVDNMLLKMEEQCPGTPIDVLLCWANMAKNSLQMCHGFSSYQLVFGKNPNLPNIMTEQPPAHEGSSTSEMLVRHLNSLHAARKAFIESETDERIRRALRNKIRASEQVFNPGDRVYYKRESQERWLGPAKVIFQDGKVVFVRHGGTYVRVSPNRLLSAGGVQERKDEQTQAKQTPTRGQEFLRQSECVTETLGREADRPGDNPQGQQTAGTGRVNAPDSPKETRERAAPQNINLVKDDKIVYKIKDSDNWTEATVLSRGGKMTGNHRNWFNVRNGDGEERGVNLDTVCGWERAEEEDVNLVLVPKHRHSEEKCDKAKQTELKKLQDFNTYEEVDDVGQFRISTTWVIWDKGDEMRARLVARGYEDMQEYPKDSPTIGKSAVRVVLAITASKGWTIRTTDIRSAFLQGKQIERDVYLTPPKEAEVKKGVIWKLKHSLYGLNDAARQFYLSVAEQLLRTGCVQSTLDPALFFKFDKGQLIGIVACHVDDFLHAGTTLFEDSVMKSLRERFLAGKVEGVSFRYVGFNIRQDLKSIIMDHSDYVMKVGNGEIDPNRAASKQDNLNETEQKLLRQLVGRLNWAVQGSRPDLGFELIDLSTKLKQGTVSDLIRAIKCIERLRSGPSVVRFPAMGRYEEWRLIVFTDASLANLEGCGSVGGRVCFLVNSQGDACPLSWSSAKIKRVVRSTLSAEMLSLQEGIEDAIYLRGIVTELFGKPEKSLPIIAYVDNKSVTQALSSTKLVDDKRLRIDIASIKQCMERSEISAVKWVQGDEQLANCLTKRGASGYQLMQVLVNGKLCGYY